MQTTRFLTLSLILAAGPALAEAPVLQNSGPIIYLADNLDEEDQLGYCIDTKDRGQTDRIQTHSCKPDTDEQQDKDVLFSYDEDSGRIEHAAFEGYCLTVNEPGSETELGLYTCEDGSTAQQFSFDAASGAIHPGSDETLCLAASAESDAAGPYMSRPLGIQPCAEVDEVLRQWVIQEG